MLLRERLDISETAFVQIVIWHVPQSVRGSNHPFKYSLALISNDICVLRYDNEAGKGDHKHVFNREIPYQFMGLQKLKQDFVADVSAWRNQQWQQ